MSKIKKPDGDTLDYIKENYSYQSNGTINGPYGTNIGSMTITPNRTYYKVAIKGRNYRRYHVIWLLCKGEWPRSQLNHVDRDCTNDLIDNLRECNDYTQQQNKENYSGYLGFSILLCTDKVRKKPWRIRCQSTKSSLGYFETRELAISFLDELSKNEEQHRKDMDEILFGGKAGEN